MTDTKVPWRKILYEKQPYPDNYTDDSFLEELKKNLYTELYNFRTVIYESGRVSEQLCTICIFVSLFIYMDVNILTPSTLFCCMIACFVMGCSLMDKLEGMHVDMKTCVLVSMLVFGVSPILQTLTITISTDTIYAMTTGLLIANMLFHDYGPEVAMVSKALSVNSSMFAAVCLASRLPTWWHTYVTIMLAIQLFVLFPKIRKAMRTFNRTGQVILTETLVVLCTFLLVPISLIGSLCFVIAHLSITFVFPLWFVHLQRLKNNIHGPWDEAMVQK